MSSYVIEKKDLMIAAGFIAAFAEAENCHRDPMIRIYNFKDNRVMNADDFKKSFELIHRMNAESVQLRYNDESPMIDTADYSAEFAAAKAKTKKMIIAAKVGDSKDLEKMIYRFYSFSTSILYQIEDLKMNTQVKNFLNDILARFLAVLVQFRGFASDCESWGGFDVITENEREIIPLF